MDYFKRKLDDKNRLTIPVEVRRELEGAKVILTPGFKNYLHLYSQPVWENDMKQALSGAWKAEGDRPAILDEELADIADHFLDGHQVTSLDAKQGRLTIDPELLEYAGLDRSKEVSATRMPAGYWRIKAKPSK